MNDNDKFHHAGDIIKKLFDRIVPEEAAGYSGFFSGWAKMAGEETAFHVRPKDIINGTLILETDHPGWSQRIKMREEGLLRIIRREYPDLEIKRFRVVIDGGSKTQKRVQNTANFGQQDVTVKKDTMENFNGEDEKFFALLEKFRRNGDS